MTLNELQSGSRTPGKPSEESPSLASTDRPSTTATLTAAAAQVLNTPQRTTSTTPKGSPVVSSPLPPMHKGKTLSSTKSASWAARLHAQPSTAVQSARRHTTEEALPAVPAVHSLPGSAYNSARGSLDGDAAGLSLDLLGLDDQLAGNDWQQPGSLQQGFSQTADQASLGDGAQHSGENQAVNAEQPSSLQHQETSQTAEAGWIDSANEQGMHHLPGAAWPQQHRWDDAHQHATNSQADGLVLGPAQHPQLAGLFSQQDLAGSLSNLQAEPSIVSTSNDIQQNDLWLSAEPSMASSSSDLQQLHALHDADDFGGYESAASAQSHSHCERHSSPQCAERHLVADAALAHAHMQDCSGFDEAGIELEAWGSFVLPEAGVSVQAPQPHQQGQVQHAPDSQGAHQCYDANTVSDLDMDGLQPEQRAKGVYDKLVLSSEHLDAKQQRQLELFMSSLNESDASR